MKYLVSWTEMSKVLRCFGCDRTEQGEFILHGYLRETYQSFLGHGDEWKIGDDAVCYVAGKPRNLVTALQGACCGIKVTITSDNKDTVIPPDDGSKKE